MCCGPCMAVLDEQRDVLSDSVDQLYDDWFIETCEEWLVPYLGELVGYQLLHGYDEALGSGTDDAGAVLRAIAPRRDVADTVANRRRKGTLAILEELAADVAGLPARAVEFRRLLGLDQPVRLFGTDPVELRDRLSVGRRVDVRGRGLARPGRRRRSTQLAHPVDVRRVDSFRTRGLAGIEEVGLFVWRLGSYSVTRAPAYCEDRDRSRFTFSILGNDTPLVRRAGAGAVTDPPRRRDQRAGLHPTARVRARPADYYGPRQEPVPLHRRASGRAGPAVADRRGRPVRLGLHAGARHRWRSTPCSAGSRSRHGRPRRGGVGELPLRVLRRPRRWRVPPRRVDRRRDLPLSAPASPTRRSRPRWPAGPPTRRRRRRPARRPSSWSARAPTRSSCDIDVERGDRLTAASGSRQPPGDPAAGLVRQPARRVARSWHRRRRRRQRRPTVTLDGLLVTGRSVRVQGPVIDRHPARLHPRAGLVARRRLRAASIPRSRASSCTDTPACLEIERASSARSESSPTGSTPSRPTCSSPTAYSTRAALRRTPCAVRTTGTPTWCSRCGARPCSAGSAATRSDLVENSIVTGPIEVVRRQQGCRPLLLGRTPTRARRPLPLRAGDLRRPGARAFPASPASDTAPRPTPSSTGTAAVGDLTRRGRRVGDGRVPRPVPAAAQRQPGAAARRVHPSRLRRRHRLRHLTGGSPCTSTPPARASTRPSTTPACSRSRDG